MGGSARAGRPGPDPSRRAPFHHQHHAVRGVGSAVRGAAVRGTVTGAVSIAVTGTVRAQLVFTEDNEELTDIRPGRHPDHLTVNRTG